MATQTREVVISNNNNYNREGGREAFQTRAGLYSCCNLTTMSTLDDCLHSKWPDLYVSSLSLTAAALR